MDVAVTLVVTAATVVPTVAPHPRAWWIVGLAVLASVPVRWRRRAPIRTALVAGLAMTLLVLWEKPLLPFGPLVCVYTIAAVSPPLVRMAAVPVIGSTVFVSLALPHEDADVYRGVGTAFIAAYALGTSARARRAHAAELAERARRLAEEHAAAAAGERVRIARDMHDIVAHAVGLMIVQAEAGPLVVRSHPDRAEAAFDAVADTGRGALAQLRGLLGALRVTGDDGGTHAVEPLPGLDSMPMLVERAGQTGLEISLAAEGRRPERPVPAHVGVAAYRITQEALTNVLRHADARHAHVWLRWTETTLTVEVTDDGRGPGDPVGGYGLAGMRERAAVCGGSLRAGPPENPRERGFVVTATLPLG
ncbi:sensor histidine kinase [Frankia sp. R82]|uniref:sensor histidine kinase n=1 Tax=Frankia sp. R82 TaxID=2950553 RepID=UPI002044AC7B|nr:histidine kinase [Frankia sp. R82]MCM3885534.1 histidine kinase [Frankia sp. R82]